jgi:hypothetical protein
MTGLEVVVGLLVAWGVRKARRVGKRVDETVDEALDLGLDRLHDLVTGKLGADPALERLQLEAAQSGEVGNRTQARVRMSLEEAVEEDPEFAQRLEAAVQEAQKAVGQATADGHGVAVSGGVNASGSGIAIGGVTGGSVNLYQDPSGPART